jgi:hypothetical protein
MGAVNFCTYADGTDLQSVFKETREQAQYDYGHSGYSGTIAEKSSVVLRCKEPFTPDEASDFIETDQHKNDKWGPCFAVRVKGKSKWSNRVLDGFCFYGFASE